MEKKESIEDKLKKYSELMKKAPPLYKIETDEQGRWLLDPNNPHHVEWVLNDDAYEKIEENPNNNTE